MQKFKVLSIIILLSLFAGILPVQAEGEPPVEKGKITVYTQTSIGNPVSAVSISVQGTGYQQTKPTDDSGKAIFDDLSPQKYTVIINLTSNTIYELVSGEIATKERTIVANSNEEVYFGLKAKPTDETTEEEAEELKIELPATFRKSGSSTTNLSNLTKDDLKSLKELILHIPNKAKIIFKEEVNLSEETTIGRLAKLDNYVFMDQTGEVTIASDLMPELNKKANVTLYGLNIVAISNDFKPIIVRDDMDANDKISNIKLVNKNTISFDVTGFSTYAYRPTLIIDQEEITTTEENAYVITGKIDDLDSEITVYLNNKKLEDEIVVNEDGSFEIKVVIDEGKNIIQIMAKGISEQINAQTIEITHGEEIEEVVATEKKDNNVLIVVGVITTLIILGFLGYWYYSKKNNKPMFGFLKNKNINNEMPYDEKLLTKEEIATYKDNGPDTTMSM